MVRFCRRAGFLLMLSNRIQVANGISAAPASLYSMLKGAGVANVCHSCYDVADANSVANGTTQTMVDLVGGTAPDFYRGSNGTSQSVDPTFNGTAGDFLESTYYSFDGADYMVGTGADSVVGDFHHQGCAWSVAGMVYINNLSNFHYLFSNIPASVEQGIAMQVTASGEFGVVIGQWNGSSVDYFGATGIAASTGWHFVAASYEDGGATDSSFIRFDDTVSRTTLSLTETGQTTSSTLNIGRGLNGLNVVRSGTRLGCLAFFNAALSEGQMERIYQRLKAKRHSGI